MSDAKCTATKTIEDECSIMSYRCELPRGHKGDHRTTYPGQWGEVRVPVSWSRTKAKKAASFHRNARHP